MIFWNAYFEIWMIEDYFPSKILWMLEIHFTFIFLFYFLLNQIKSKSINETFPIDYSFFRKFTVSQHMMNTGIHLTFSFFPFFIKKSGKAIEY